MSSSRRKRKPVVLKVMEVQPYLGGVGFHGDVEALRLSVPAALYIQNSLLGEYTEMYCYQASHIGVKVLRRLGYRAEILPCAIMAQGPGWGISVGHTPESIYETYFRDLPGGPSLEEWVGSYDPTNKAPMHMAIEAFGPMNERLIIDLSFGQLRMGGYRELPSAIVLEGDGWPRFSTADGGAVAYSKCPHQVDPTWFQSGEMQGSVDFVLRAMGLAHQCHLDPDLFAVALSESVQLR